MSHLTPLKYKKVLTWEERVKAEQENNWKEYNRIRNSGPISLQEERELADEFGLFEEDSVEDSVD
jgi:Ni,Fe-hydrogenase III component G